MPIYEYRCAACEHQFEEWQKMSDPPVRKCPSCKGRRVERLVSATSFHLKGGGWYSDGYASSKSSSSKSENSPKAKAKAKAESSTSSANTSSASTSSASTSSASTAASAG